MADSLKQDALQQLTDAWKTAQRQLAELRAAVERTGELAQLKVQGEFAGRELDRAYRELGAAVWEQVKKGKLELPAAVVAAAKRVEVAEQKKAAQAASINDLLAEGPEVAGRLRKSAVAPKGKKR